MDEGSFTSSPLVFVNKKAVLVMTIPVPKAGETIISKLCVMTVVEASRGNDQFKTRPPRKIP